MSLGQRLLGISHRGRWLLFSDVIEYQDPGVRLLKAGSPDEKREDAVFDNEFFRSAKRVNHTNQNQGSP